MKEDFESYTIEQREDDFMYGDSLVAVFKSSHDDTEIALDENGVMERISNLEAINIDTPVSKSALLDLQRIRKNQP